MYEKRLHFLKYNYLICNVFYFYFSDSESEAEEENDYTAEARGERSPSPSHQEESDPDTDDSLEQIEGEGAGDVSSSANVDSHQVQEARPKPNLGSRFRAQTPTSELEGALGSQVRKSRKRCASTPSSLNLGQSTSSTSEDLRELNPPTNKKRRFPSISFSGPRPDSHSTNGSGAATGEFPGLGGHINPSWGNLTPEEYAIRKKMMQV
jgi:hypothetical protein